MRSTTRWGRLSSPTSALRAAQRTLRAPPPRPASLWVRRAMWPRSKLLVAHPSLLRATSMPLAWCCLSCCADGCPSRQILRWAWCSSISTTHRRRRPACAPSCPPLLMRWCCGRWRRNQPRVSAAPVSWRRRSRRPGRSLSRQRRHKRLLIFIARRPASGPVPLLARRDLPVLLLHRCLTSAFSHQLRDLLRQPPRPLHPPVEGVACCCRCWACCCSACLWAV